jgi:hypothetical protein
MHYSVHTPSQFISTHLDRLLPNWVRPVSSVLIVLQPSSCNLLERSPAVEAQKQLLRQKFLKFGHRVALQLQQIGHLADVFDPRTGFPTLSQPGQLSLDDVAVARACLGYPSTNSCGCSVILHPNWGSFVYPSTVVSSAEPELVKWVLEKEGERREEKVMSYEF